MKQKIYISIFVVLVFIFITELMSENNSAADGWDLYGFPFIFYKYTGGKLIDRTAYDELGFIPGNFLLDLLILGLAIVSMNYIVIITKIFRG